MDNIYYSRTRVASNTCERKHPKNKHEVSNDVACKVQGVVHVVREQLVESHALLSSDDVLAPTDAAQWHGC